MNKFWNQLSVRQQDYFIAGINIAALVLASVLIFLNYLDQGIIYQLANNDFRKVVDYFGAKPLEIQMGLVMIFVLIEVIVGLIPAVVMYPIIGALINPWLGITLIFLGNLIGNSVNYYQGKVIARAFVDDKKHLKILHRLDDDGAWSLLLIRLNPLTSFDAISYFAGALGMKYKKFLLATMVGITPLVISGTLAGDQFLEKFEFGFEILVIFTIGYLIYTIFESIRKRKLRKKDRLLNKSTRNIKAKQSSSNIR